MSSYLNKEGRRLTHETIAQNTWPEHNATLCIGYREKSKLLESSCERIMTKRNPDINFTREIFRKIRCLTMNFRRADKCAFDIEGPFLLQGEPHNYTY